MNDTLIKEKMESLDTLSGGIVFGKEEAWDKLQSRMDKKPVRKIVLWYRLAAAAAILLLFISIAVIYYTPEKQIANSQPPAPVKEEMETTPATSIAITEPQPEMIVTQERATRKHKQQPIRFVIKEEQPVAQPEPPDIVAPQPAIVNIVPPPTKPDIKKMRVIHINELGNYEEQPANAIVYTGPSLDIRKMRVVSIYDVQREEQMYRQEQDIITIARINRPHNSIFSLPYSLNRNNPYDNQFAQNRLILRLNRNN